jgi:hypothetical protein
MLVVAAFIADITIWPTTAITATRRLTKSATNAGTLSFRPSTHRYSIATLCP